MSIKETYVRSTNVHLQRTTYYNKPNPRPPTSNLNLKQPYPQLGFVQLVASASHSSYNSLQIRLQQRFAHRFSLLSSFAQQKSIDNGSRIRQPTNDAYVPQDVNNLRAKRGRSAFDFHQNWTTSKLYELPFRHGKAILDSANRVVDLITGGWQVKTIFTWSTGFPFSVDCTNNGTYQNTDTTCRADATKQNPNISNNTPNAQFNKDAFVNQTDFVANVDPYQFGTSDRNVITRPRIAKLDFSVQKVFRFSEHTNLEFRSEFFNLPNHPIFRLPRATVNTTAYNIISSTRIDSRQIQFGLKLRF